MLRGTERGAGVTERRQVRPAILAMASLWLLCLAGAGAQKRQGVALVQNPPPDAVKPGWILTFNDEFTGPRLDRKKWDDKFAVGRDHSEGAEYYAPDNYEIKDGLLLLKAQKRQMGGKNFTSSMICSHISFAQQYGWFEIRCKVPSGKRMWPVFWLMPTTHKWPPEIDVMEFANDSRKLYLTNVWRIGPELNDISSSQKPFVGPDYSRDFHTFAIEWKPEEIVWYVDGRRKHSSRKGIPHEPMYLLATFQIAGNSAYTAEDDRLFPAAFAIDYIRVYKRAQ